MHIDGTKKHTTLRERSKRRVMSYEDATGILFHGQIRGKSRSRPGRYCRERRRGGQGGRIMDTRGRWRGRSRYKTTIHKEREVQTCT